MIDYRHWKTRLETELGNKVDYVSYSTGLREATTRLVRSDVSVLIIPNSSRSEDHATTKHTGSHTTCLMDIVVIATDFTDAVGESASSTAYEISKDIYKIIHGWLPPDAINSARKRGEKVTPIGNGALAWAITFKCKMME